MINYAAALLSLFFLFGCSDDEPAAEEPVAAESEGQSNATGEDEEAAGASGNEATESENGYDELDSTSPSEDAATAPAPEEEEAPKPMKEPEKGGGIISGGAKPIDGDATFQDCVQIQGGKASPGYVAYGCTAKTADGQRASRVKGNWQITGEDGKRVKIKNLQFPKGGKTPYDVTFEVPNADSTKALSASPRN